MGSHRLLDRCCFILQNRLGWHLEKLGEYSGVVFVYSGAMLKPLHGTEVKDLRVALELCFMVYSLCRRFTAPVL